MKSREEENEARDQRSCSRAPVMISAEAMGYTKLQENPSSLARRIITIVFAVIVFSCVLAAYITEFQITHDPFKLTSFGLYGVILVFHLLMQSFFAYLEHRQMRRDSLVCSYQKKVALTISAFQEDPTYLRQCLVSAKDTEYPPDKLKVIMIIDGNSQEDLYMMDMFLEVFREEEEVGTYIWQENYHSWWTETEKEKKGNIAELNQNNSIGTLHHSLRDTGRERVEELIKTKRCVCIMQKWGGKREVMYTAFKALGDSVDYIQVCDSDTKLDHLATVELVKVLESNERYGAVGGDVKILNLSDSFISFMSSLRYWMAFNVERACQSYFNCVSCISGPLGLYRNDLLQEFLEPWYHQTFLGTHCTFGDDRHLTNRMLSIGYATKYTVKSMCYSETPAQYLRWLNQQTRWTKSFFREWLYNALWWHKHHLWMTYESIVAGIFPFFVTVTMVKIFYTGGLWHILWVLLCIQIMGLAKALYASWFRGNLIMVFMSLYSALYMTGLLPTKYFAILTMNKTSWGTSGRKKKVGNYIAMVPLSIWWMALLGGLAYTISKDLAKDWDALQQQKEKFYLLYGSLAYIFYWVFMVLLYWVWVRKLCRKKSKTYHVSNNNDNTKSQEHYETVEKGSIYGLYIPNSTFV
ncbi:hyaluronan synthase 1-like isoform X1 [Rhinatrema bivittatum]|uniref:hyaluronan synthase 1-like isoform X1 n=2 Tax=Rhinatrema bivittatum TaxID=194408 RepID=UPI00112C055F|nr:hyaluronan synthase 1-like isoform X1 [Rhinatrema bivittatum]